MRFVEAVVGDEECEVVLVVVGLEDELGRVGANRERVVCELGGQFEHVVVAACQVFDWVF